ncbi:class I SAM-dependent DNA methyltransferase [Saccharothrix violaceirubra]|uniref:SAM-dependent methyltransferase n=1 Tax=Saccharothrix violaceirubra TaxID=413306 RepID=A0A7W7T354_9PSEU|nr:class I SAM-dependent methyltransferase [Saccharothrix violaceirubra]MBB4965714.1 SAM-dependent methyltransferase [Saccharothrix violaceirubra]
MSWSDAQYDELGERYERVKHIPSGLAERATLLQALPDLAGRTVLDVGCGTGFYPRLFRTLGATRIVGVDSSTEMLACARRAGDDIDYHHLDATDLPVLGEFDVVTAIWLLAYADDDAHLDRMIANLAANLTPDGTLALLIPNPDVDWDVVADYTRYGYRIVRTGPPARRQPVAVQVSGEPPFDFASYFWAPGAVEAAVARVGLAEPVRHPTVVPAGDPAFWADLRRSPAFAVLTTRRPA